MQFFQPLSFTFDGFGWTGTALTTLDDDESLVPGEEVSDLDCSMVPALPACRMLGRATPNVFIREELFP